MSLSYVRFCLAAAVLFLCCAASPADPNTAALLPAPFVITLHVANAPGKDYFDLDDSNSSFDLTIKNISNGPQKIYAEWCASGYYNVSLRITAINGQLLSVPVPISKELRPWAANATHTDTICPGRVIERHIFLYDLRLLYIVTPESEKSQPSHDNRLISGIRLPRLSGTNSSRFETITVCAVFDPSNTSGLASTSDQIVSAPITLKTGL